ncbi:MULTISPECIES: FCD domain-containing protein [unclassified Variovorax]|uniref:FCD domain-containing protein n=1 Tax=unclassified Variovorax TaxID=663243 RepID=UPI0013185DED|nr:MULTISPECIES: FCD domain-containing protein [unclassified Variovorax]VTU12987.1 transcriptional regulator NanR [Variovorax sp. SRS16]VTU16791.1 transcriptional regulator NanR [Variovorax sp. PBL-E5]
MSDKESIESLEEHSLTDLIQREIEGMLVRGELVAGSRINEKRLAENLKVSRAPVREVTRALEQIGLVEIIRNRGVFVRNVNLKDVVAIFDIRMALARLAATEAARRMTAVSAKALGGLLERMDAASSAEEYLPLNLEFHRQIFLLSDNPRLAQLEISLSKELRLYRLRGLRSGNSMNTSKEEHREILAALIDHNPELAGRLFEQHILAGRDRFLSTVDRQEPPPPKRRGRPRKNPA